MNYKQRHEDNFSSVGEYEESANWKSGREKEEIDKAKAQSGNFPPPPASRCGSRHVFAFMAFFGMVVAYLMRVNLSVAIVAMIRKTQSDNITLNMFYRDAENGTSDLCQNEETDIGGGYKGEFDWDSNDKGLLLGCFFWGYMVMQIPAGMIAEKFGGKYVFGIGLFINSILTLLSPVSARSSASALIAVRSLTGFAQGVAFPSVNSMLSKWVPSSERSTIGAFVLAGTQFGTVVGLPLSGVLCDIELDNGWPWAFYVPGIIGVIWFLAWMVLVYDSPELHPRIAEDEKNYITATTGRKAATVSLSDAPWKSLLTSVHLCLWAIVVAHVGHNWGFYMLLTELPSYMDSVLHFNLKSNGLLSALPYLVMWILSMVCSIIADALRNRCLNTTVTRKIFNTIGMMTPACALIGAAYTGCDTVSTVALITLATGFSGAIYSGFMVNHVDVASNYAGIMMGISNCFSSICGFLAPYIVNAIVTEPGSLYQWKIVFFASAAVYTVTNLFYVIFGTGVEQSWNKK